MDVVARQTGRSALSFKPHHPSAGALSRDLEALRWFCEIGDDVLWVTFYAGRLWWCFARPGVEQLADDTKIRHVDGAWNSCDILGGR